MIDELKNNVNTEIQMLREMASYINRIPFSSAVEERLLKQTIYSLKNSMHIINSAIPKLLNEITLAKRLPSKEPKKTELEKIGFQRVESKIDVILQQKDREKFLKELSISENLIRRLKKKEFEGEKEEYYEFKAARGYLKLSNKFFLKKAIELINKGWFKPLSREITRANIEVLFETYVAMMFFTAFISIFAGIFIFVFLMFFNVGFAFPFISFFSGNYLMRFAQTFWIPVVLPFLVFGFLYVYPSTEKKSIARRVEQELPFAVIHMSAISGSGIEPSEIFRIIGLSNEYKYLRVEIRKVLNQINLYGYDLVTALTNVSKSTSSQKLAELFSGLGTTINSGGSLQEFFEKRAETLLASYRLERERYTRVAETFMDIYISVVIAAPMILMLLFIMISVTNIAPQFSPELTTLIIIGIVALINILFLGFLNIKQPAY